jgi:translation initiation factor 5B
LLIIDTPGHESFSNLRNRGSSLSDLAILVIDIMHGLENQTIESIELLKKRKTPFIVALNKVDRIVDWQKSPNGAIQASLKKQKQNTLQEFDTRVELVKLALAEKGFNSALYYENTKNMASYVNIVPTSAHTGEGIPDLLYLIAYLNQRLLTQQLTFREELDATVMEVKAIAGLGTTVDIVLRNGVLHEGQTIVLCGLEGPIVTNIRSLLMPEPLKVKLVFVYWLVSTC